MLLFVNSHCITTELEPYQKSGGGSWEIDRPSTRIYMQMNTHVKIPLI